MAETLAARCVRLTARFDTLLTRSATSVRRMAATAIASAGLVPAFTLCILIANAPLTSAQPAVLAVILEGSGYNRPAGPDTPWPSGNFTVGTPSQGIIVSSTLGGSGGSLSMHIATAGPGLGFRSIGGLDVYVRGNPGTPFHLDWTCSESVAANVNSTDSSATAALLGGICGGLAVQVVVINSPPGSDSKSHTASGAIDGVSSGRVLSDPRFPGVTYSYAAGFLHWAQLDAGVGRFSVYSGSTTADWNISVTGFIGGDSDHDGVPNSADACPEVAGPAPTGCPDSDGDGVLDKDDRCPTVSGPAPTGCPDSDGDGDPDGDDKCPNEAGLAISGRLTSHLGAKEVPTVCPNELTITTSSLPVITAGEAYVMPVLATGGTPPYTWNVGPGSGSPLSFFPDNVKFNQNGLAAFISTEAMTRVAARFYTFSVDVTDTSGAKDARTLELTVSCGDSELDSVSDEYITQGAIEVTGLLPSPPVCQDFTRSAEGGGYSFAQLTVNSGAASALIRLPLTVSEASGYGLAQWVALYKGSGGSRLISSGYRTPQHNSTLPGSAKGSRHMWGDAVDLNNNSRTRGEWEAMYKAAQNARASYVETLKESGIAHVHADWRNKVGPYQHGAGGK